MRKYLNVCISSICVLAFLSSLTACATAQSGALSRAQSSFKEKDYHACLARLSEAESYGDFSESANAQISFYRGLCLEGQGRKAEAAAVYQNLIRKYPNSDWSAQAQARLGR